MNADTPAAASDSVRILLIEDHRDIALLMRLILERSGYIVELSMTARGAEHLFTKHHFDLIISDIMLPDGTGWELLPRLHSVKRVKAIALSALTSQSDIERSLQAGFLFHVNKPVSQTLLNSIIAKALSA